MKSDDSSSALSSKVLKSTAMKSLSASLRAIPITRSGRNLYGDNGTQWSRSASRPELSVSTAPERAIQFFEPLVDVRPARLLARNLRRSIGLFGLKPLDFSRRTRQLLLVVRHKGLKL
jgi:hypothetical protein